MADELTDRQYSWAIALSIVVMIAFMAISLHYIICVLRPGEWGVALVVASWCMIAIVFGSALGFGKFFVERNKRKERM